jgi:hypothetical protein
MGTGGRISEIFKTPDITIFDGTVKHTNMHRRSKQVEAKYLSNKMHKYHPRMPFQVFM